MTKYEILTYPHEILLKPTRPVENIDGRFQEVIEDMAALMYEAPGVGLAAPQVGIDRHFFIYDVAPHGEAHDLKVLVNPRIVASEGETVSENEGCLSIPDYRADVRRKAVVVVEGLDRDGNPVSFEAGGFLAVVMQHEIDHLNGILFIDHLSSLKRNLFKRRIKKMMKN